ncbi:MAG: sigma-70 family RNA polymerase sigma factor [Ruminococcus sp.]|nr:sigma-70 family RNA polymerase sigma factor [Ruminococcus sp.]
MSREDFDRIYEGTKESVHRFVAAKCFSLDDVDDIYQNVWLAMFEALEKRKDPIPNEEAFVMLIAKRQLGRYYSLAAKLRNLVSVERNPEVSAELPDSIDVEDELMGRELISEIGALVRKRPLTAQKIFYFYYGRGLTVSEIASVMEMKETTVKKHIYSTLEQIRKLYERRERL